MPSSPDMKHMLYRPKPRNSDEAGPFVRLLVWMVLAFILILLGHSVTGLVHQIHFPL
jgi:hypothetical protein